MRREQDSLERGENQTAVVFIVSAIGSILALLGGIWLDHGWPFTQGLGTASGIFTIFAFVVTWLQLRSVRQVQQEKAAIRTAERQYALRKSLIAQITIAQAKTQQIRMAMRSGQSVSGLIIAEETSAMLQKLRDKIQIEYIPHLRMNLNACISELHRIIQDENRRKSGEKRTKPTKLRTFMIHLREYESGWKMKTRSPEMVRAHEMKDIINLLKEALQLGRAAPIAAPGADTIEIRYLDHSRATIAMEYTDTPGSYIIAFRFFDPSGTELLGVTTRKGHVLYELLLDFWVDLISLPAPGSSAATSVLQHLRSALHS